MTTLYRAASAVQPYFGTGSYWTTSRQFADMFRTWAHSNLGTPSAIYQADVDLCDLLAIPIGTWAPSPRINELVEDFAERGYLWVSFYEGVHEGELTAQYVYLGSSPIEARRVD